MNYNELKNKEIVERTIKALNERNVETVLVESGAEALAKIKELIPKGSSVMNGSSVTLEQIGFMDYLNSGEHGWDNLHKKVLAENDPVKRKILRREVTVSDFYLGSVHAVAETGEMVIATNSGSQMPHIVFTSTNIIFVASTKKITPTLNDAMDRLHKHVIPLEEVHMQNKYGTGTYPSKILIFNRESPTSGRKVKMILVNEDLGF